MLIEFGVTNYRSFRDRGTLSMLAAKPYDDDQGRLFVADERPAKPVRLLRSAAIYGANASGKSNLVAALALMRHLVSVSGSRRSGLSRSHTPFRLDAATRNAPTEFEVTAIVDGERYTYGFAFGADEVNEEWLYAGLPRTRLLFCRTGQRIEFGDSWRGEREALWQRTRTDALLLSVAADYNNPVASAIAKWFEATLSIHTTGPSDLDRTALEMASDSPQFREQLLKYLDAADLGIRDIVVERGMVEPAFVLTPGRHRFTLTEGDPDGDYQAEALWATTKRLGSDGELVQFDLDGDESDGTARMVELAGAWVSSLANEQVLVIDEYDSRLHPRLSRFLLNTWHQAHSRAQLVLTTHNADLLDGDLLRSDQVWFAEKGRAQSTSLYSLAEFRGTTGRKPHASDNFRRSYLAGRYGAVPILVEMDHAAKT